MFAGNNTNPTTGVIPALTAIFDYFYNSANIPVVPDLTLTKSHTGSFPPAGRGIYDLTIRNAGNAPTTGTVMVTDTMPAGLTPESAVGTGWNCTIDGLAVSCTRSDTLVPQGSYPPVVISVSVASTAASSLVNIATVAGGGEVNTANDTASDPTLIGPPIITNVAASNTTIDAATIQWTTDRPSTSQVAYGVSPTYGNISPDDQTLLTSHSIPLTALTCGTLYHYRVTSTDAGGANPASSPDATFSTAPCLLSGAPVSDNFDSALLSPLLWKFVNPLGDGYLAMNGSSVLLTVPAGTPHDVGTAGDQSVRIMQSVSNVDFEIEVKYESAVMLKTQMQGITVEQDGNNLIHFDVRYDGVTARVHAVSFLGGTAVVAADVPIASTGAPIWLRLSRKGDTWTGSWSVDGTAFSAAATFTAHMSVFQVGVFAGNSGSPASSAPAFTSSVEYFFDTAAPIANTDGPKPFKRVVIDPNPPATMLERALADIKGDGRLQPVVGFGPPSTGGIYWYEYPASGVITDLWIKHTIVGSGRAYEDMVPMDVNNDGAVDLVASLDGQVVWLENPRGHGGNPASDPWNVHVIGAGLGEASMVLADIDGDGLKDIVTNAFVYFQNSPTSWTQVTYNPGAFRGVALLDIGSGKGPINLVATGPAPYDIVWFENPREQNGSARTGAWIQHRIGPGYVCDASTTCKDPQVATFAAADLNGDGKMDVLSAQSEGDFHPPAGGLIWWEAPVDRRNGTWIKHTIDAGFMSAHQVRIVDVDGNGTPDIVTSEQEQAPQRRVSVFYNDGLGNFKQQVLSNVSGHNTTVGDITKDGAPDILNSPPVTSGRLIRLRSI